jgi:Fe-S oxidoreductase
MGLIHWWAKLAARAPRLVNAAAHAPGISALAKATGGIAAEREIPRFADRTFRTWWRERGGETTGGSRVAAPDQPPFEGAAPTDAGRRRVILWVDTFNDHFHPQVAQAAVAVLEHAGCDVVVPERTLCCGRPLYDWGFLGQAKRLLEHVLTDLRDEIRAGVPIVGLEPSCVSVFRDEAPNLLDGHNDARRIAAQTHTLTEFLDSLDGYRPPRLEGRALVHGHCHHKSVLDFESELRVLRATGLDLDVPETGCCGMAGAFGFERSGDHYRVSMAAGERALLPAVRGADDATYVVTGGFSCREQIEQATGRQVLHPAELLAHGIDRSAGDRGGRSRDVDIHDETGRPGDPARRPAASTAVSS